LRNIRPEAGPKRFGRIHLSLQGPGIDGLKPGSNPVEKGLEEAGLPEPQFRKPVIISLPERGLGMPDDEKFSQSIHH
jgi:hypothetical protein